MGMGGLERWNRILHACGKLNRQISLLEAHTKMRPSSGTGRALPFGLQNVLQESACSAGRFLICRIRCHRLHCKLTEARNDEPENGSF